MTRQWLTAVWLMIAAALGAQRDVGARDGGVLEDGAAGDDAAGVVPFAENLGQWDSHVAFAAFAGGPSHRLVVRAEAGGVAVQVEERATGRGAVMRLAFEEGAHWTTVGLEQRSTKLHSLLGNRPEAWVRDIGVFDGVGFRDASGALRAEVLLQAGRFVLRAPAGHGLPPLRVTGRQAMAALAPPLAAMAQSSSGAQEVSLPLDLGLVWSTYLGGSLGHLERLELCGYHRGNPSRAVAVGYSNCADFPVTAGAYTAGPPGSGNITAACFDADSGAIFWSTLIGGYYGDYVYAADVGLDGDVYMGGWTISKDFPTTPGAHQTTFESGPSRAFALRLAATGDELVFSTYLGGVTEPAGSEVSGIRARTNGAVVITGITSAASFPTTQGAYDTTYNGSGDAFVAELSGDEGQLVWSTFLGAGTYDTGLAVDLNPDGAVTVAVSTGSGHFPTTPGAFSWNKLTLTGVGGAALCLVRLEPDGSALRWSAMIGWKGGSLAPNAFLRTTPKGDVVFASEVNGAPMPVTPGVLQPTFGGQRENYIGVLSADGSQLLAGTYVGNVSSDGLGGLDVDASGVITTGGLSTKLLQPHAWLTEPVVSPTNHNSAAVVRRFSPDLARLLFGQTFGGNTGFASAAYGVSLLPRGGLLVVGTTGHIDFPVTEGAFQPTAPGNQYDGFVLRHRMLPAGVFPLGRPGPDCARDAYLSASGPAQAGNGNFALYASNLPPMSHGVLVIGAVADPAIGLPGGILSHVQLDSTAVLLPWYTGPQGYAAADLPLPATIANFEVAAQILVHAPDACAPDDFAWTHALRITLTP